jgi:hypothetical protein
MLNVHPRVAQMSMGHGSFDTTMKYYTGLPADLQEQAAEALGEPHFGVSNGQAVDPTPVNPRTVGGTEYGVAGETPAKQGFWSALGRTRTCGLLIRRPNRAVLCGSPERVTCDI